MNTLLLLPKGWNSNVFALDLAAAFFGARSMVAAYTQKAGTQESVSGTQTF